MKNSIAYDASQTVAQPMKNPLVPLSYCGWWLELKMKIFELNISKMFREKWTPLHFFKSFKWLRLQVKTPKANRNFFFKCRWVGGSIYPVPDLAVCMQKIEITRRREMLALFIFQAGKIIMIAQDFHHCDLGGHGHQ